eukprot:TRINITY_DN1046_c0_g1_i1.p4 TRINITY_DN1046_c0_g1~~TRINITY_DN1046_c0_g1_i1.p4  ORF type:complete len:157 (-),score=39.50 TRINITY_DN1046_c0_g1_i1:950-1420(-)
MGSLLPGWDQNIIVVEPEEDTTEYIPWWLKGKKEVTDYKDSEARRLTEEIGRRALLEADERRRSSERRKSVEFLLQDNASENSDDEEEAEVTEDGKRRLYWWKRVNSSPLNEKQDSNVAEYKRGSYQPQFHLAGDMAYSMPAKNGPNHYGIDDIVV